MKTHRVVRLNEVPKLTSTVVTVGSYDGAHRGHRSILRALNEHARARDLEPVVITFEPHYRVFFKRETSPFLLTDVVEKLSLLEDSGIAHAVVLPFGKDLASMAAREFLAEIVIGKLGAELFVAGHDQAIGRDQVSGATAIESAAEGLPIDVLGAPPVLAADRVVSSTRIRAAVRAGEMESAAELLGRPLPLTGTVVPGDARGRTLGYPTANLSVADPYKLLPPPGVYAAEARLDPHDAASPDVRGLLYVGNRPTFDSDQQVIELFLMDWTGSDLYNRVIHVDILLRLRGDQRFAGPVELVAQIQRDEERARDYFDQPAGSRATAS